MPARLDDLRHDPLSARIANAIGQLHTLADVAAWWHGLAFDPSTSQRLDGARHGGDTPIPVRLIHHRDCTNRTPDQDCDCQQVSAAADIPAARRWQRAAKALARADRALAKLLHTPDQPWPPLQTTHILRGTPPSAPFLARIAHRCSAALTCLEDNADELDNRTARRLHEDVLKEIDAAWRDLPDQRTHTLKRPVECRNPHNNRLCRGTPVVNRKRQLCQSCLNQVNYQASKAGKAGREGGDAA